MTISRLLIAISAVIVALDSWWPCFICGRFDGRLGEAEQNTVKRE